MPVDTLPTVVKFPVVDGQCAARDSDAALAGKADTSALASLLSTVDGFPLEVDTKIANALLGLATDLRVHL